MKSLLTCCLVIFADIPLPVFRSGHDFERGSKARCFGADEVVFEVFVTSRMVSRALPSGENGTSSLAAILAVDLQGDGSFLDNEFAKLGVRGLESSSSNEVDSPLDIDAID